MSMEAQGEVLCPVRTAAQDAPYAPALITPDRTFTYHELDNLVSSAAAEVIERGWQGQRLGFLLDSSASYVLLLWAVLRAGAVACPLSTRLPPGAVRARLRQVTASALITDRAGFDPSVLPEDLIRKRQDPRNVGVTLTMDRAATVIFTSGSTGNARAAVHSFGNHYFNAVGSNQNIPLAAGDIWLLSLPLYHVGGLAILFRCALGRAAALIDDDGLASATHASMVSTQLRRLLERDDDTNLKALLLGGSAIPHGLIREAYERGLAIHTSYGLTEMASQVSTTPPDAPLEVLRTSGRVLAHRKLRINDGGEILVGGRTRFMGFVEGDEIIQPFDPNGWYATGDLGRVDENGLLRVRGRKDNAFISGGENIMPEEIERVLTAVPGVSQAVVVPVEDDEYGFRPVAFVRAEGASISEKTLRSAIEDAMPRFMVPDAFYEWPKTDEEGRLKIDRQSFRRMAAEMRR